MTCPALMDDKDTLIALLTKLVKVKLVTSQTG